MPDSSGTGIFQEFIVWVLGGISTIFLAIIGLINSKTDKKVSQDVFEEFKHGNAMSHDMTHHQLRDIKNVQDKIFQKLDSKQDK